MTDQEKADLRALAVLVLKPGQPATTPETQTPRMYGLARGVLALLDEQKS